MSLAAGRRWRASEGGRRWMSTRRVWGKSKKRRDFIRECSAQKAGKGTQTGRMHRAENTRKPKRRRVVWQSNPPFSFLCESVSLSKPTNSVQRQDRRAHHSYIRSREAKKSGACCRQSLLTGASPFRVDFWCLFFPSIFSLVFQP